MPVLGRFILDWGLMGRTSHPCETIYVPVLVPAMPEDFWPDKK